MRKLYASLLLLFFVSVNQSTVAQTTVSYSGPAVSIPDNNPAGVNIPLVVAGVGTVTDLNFRFDIGAGTCDATVGNTNAAMDHTFVGDLIFRLTPPDGSPTVAFMSRRGGTRENICLTLIDDEGGFPNVSTITSVSGSPVSGNFSPETTGMLSMFDGENANGTWTLNVSDNAGIDVGSMRRFSLIFNTPTSGSGVCTPSAPQTFTNTTPLAIPTGPAVVTSTITVSGAPTFLYDVNVFTNLTHTFASDLDITLRSPAGTVVTLTTDNGGGNDNVFAGTTWNDNANPAGQVPYTTNSGLVTDHPYVNLTPVANLAPEEALAAFIGENPNGVWTITISDDLAGDGGTLNEWRLIMTGLSSPPTITLFPFTNSTPVNILDNAVVSSTITVAGAGTQLIDVDLLTSITHTFAGDLDITLTSPAGTVVTITTDNGGGNDNVYNGTTWNDNANPGGQVPYTNNNGMVTDHLYTNLVVATPLAPEEGLGAFIGENPNGVWTIRISDDAGGDVGVLSTWTLNIRTASCAPPCSGVPSPGSIAPTTTNTCAGNSVTLTLSGFTTGSGINFQWKSSATSGGPYTDIAGATSPTYTFTAATTLYYVCVVTCTNGGGTAQTAQVVVNVSNIQHSNVTATPNPVCSPGTVTISATASGSAVAGNYTHTLTGPGTIGPPVVSGANNANVSFTVTNIPAGNQVYVLTSSNATGCNKATNVPVTVNLTPTVSLISGTTTTTASYTGPAVAVPDNVPAGVNITLPVSGLTGPVLDLNFRLDAASSGVCDNTIGNTNASMDHTFNGDLIFRLTSPAGTTVTLINRRGGGGNNFCTVLLDDDGGFPATSTMSTAGAISGNFAPENPLSAFDGQNPNGNWILNVSDNAGIDVGSLRRFSLVFQHPVAPPVICNGAIVPLTANVLTGTGSVVYSPLTELYTDASATVAYTGAPLASGTTIYAKPTVTRTYTATVTSAQGCSSSASLTITVNQLPAIVTQPSPATQTLCPGFNVIYSVSATGTGLSYQWRRNGTNLTDGVQILGSNTNTLRIFNINAANGGNYDCVVSGVCPPPVTTTPVTLVVGSAPTIVTQPANATICAITSSNNNTAVFSVAASGNPAPTIYQWQISTDGGVTYTNLANSATSSASPFYNGVFTSSLTVGNAPASLNGARYRVVVTNSCNQSTTSNGAILTVNPAPVVVATDLFSRRVCISDTLVPLVGTPVGGAWTGIGVSGFNFVPGATAVGNYVLTYTFTSSAGCIVSDTTRVFVQDCPERARLLRDDALIVYPNPNNGRFNVRMNSTLYNYLGMKVYDMSGRLVNGKITKNGIDEQLVSPTWSGLYYGRVIPIDLSYLPSGNYLVKFYYDDGVRTSEKGFIIQIMR
jgi:subtilisin-like proprotein convertase family protein